MINYYEILKINRHSTAREIKKGYNKLVRKFPPETKPNEYRKIREAYDILRDEKKREKFNKEYDEVFKENPVITALKKEADELIAQKEYYQAETTLKKILLLESNQFEAKNKLCKIFYLQGNYIDALTQMNELLELVPEPLPEYYFTRGLIFLKLNNKYSAVDDLNKVHKMDLKNHQAITYLVNIYLGNNETHKAINLLKVEMNKIRSWSTFNFICLLNLMICYIEKENKKELDKVIQELEIIIPENEKTLDFVSEKLVKLAITAATNGYGKLAMQVIKSVERINPGYKDLKRIINEVSLYKVTEKLLDDNRIEYLPIKEPIIYYMYRDRIPQTYYDECLKSINEELKTTDTGLLTDIKNSINNIKCYYKELFNMQKDVYADINDSLKKQLEIFTEYEAFLEDSNFVVSFKKCIKEIENKREKNYERAFKKLQKILDTTVRKNIASLKRYPILKERYKDFIATLEDILDKNEWPKVKAKKNIETKPENKTADKNKIDTEKSGKEKIDKTNITEKNSNTKEIKTKDTNAKDNTKDIKNKDIKSIDVNSKENIKNIKTKDTNVKDNTKDINIKKNADKNIDYSSNNKDNLQDSKPDSVNKNISNNYKENKYEDSETDFYTQIYESYYEEETDKLDKNQDTASTYEINYESKNEIDTTDKDNSSKTEEKKTGKESISTGFRSLGHVSKYKPDYYNYVVNNKAELETLEEDTASIDSNVSNDSNNSFDSNTSDNTNNSIDSNSSDNANTSTDSNTSDKNNQQIDLSGYNKPVETEEESSEGCYIATAVYGDYDAPEVMVLRRFRDNCLKRFTLGRMFIELYYRYSPELAKRLSNKSIVTRCIRKILDGFVNIIEDRF